MEIILKPIGFIHSPYIDSRPIPKQSIYSDGVHATIKILDEYVEGLSSLKSGSYGIVLFYFHKIEGYTLTVQRKPDESVGIFSTRSPHRPNKIGLSIVRFIKISGNIIEFEGVDMLDGTPVIDIKPYDEALNPKL
jgi:tRNA-Thr(GGU) m(6)t(6)A37 methyltransferase TsaA